MQIQADFLGVPVLRPRVTETTALGAAYLAGLQSGFWPDIDSVASQWREERRFMPEMDAGRRATLRNRWRHAVAAARR
jgi:glycerol kinase